MKNPFKGKKPFPTQTVPVVRTTEELRKEYYDLHVKAGGLQYNISVYRDDLKRINEALKQLTNQLVARQNEEKANTAAQLPKQEEVQNVSN